MPLCHLVLATLGILLLSQSPIDPPGLLDAAGNDSAASAFARIKLNSIIVAKVEFDKTDIATAIDFLRTKSKELDPQHLGVQFRLVLPPGYESKKPRFRREVSMTLTDVPLADMLGYIIAQTNLTYRIVQGVVILTPLSTLDSTPAQ